MNVNRIIKEDILRMIGEEEGLSLESIQKRIKANTDYISKAFYELEKKNLIKKDGENMIKLTDEGHKYFQSIFKKHILLEDYFKTISDKEEAHQKANIIEHYISKENIKNIKKLSTLKRKDISLLESNFFQENMIADIRMQDNKLFERLVSMGIFIGEKIKLMNIINENAIIYVANKKFAIDKSIAKKIRIISSN